MPPQKILIFSATNGYRHDSIPAGIAAFKELSATQSPTIEITTTESVEDLATALSSSTPKLDAVIFLSTIGEVLTPSARSSLRTYVESGGAFVGVHSASATEYTWPWYGEELLGGVWFREHPDLQEGNIALTEAGTGHPCFSEFYGPLEKSGDGTHRWKVKDEWYDWKGELKAQESTKVLAMSDKGSYQPWEWADGNKDHPLVWCRKVGEGKMWYTSLGHTEEIYGDERFKSHLLGGLFWALGRKEWSW